MAQKTKAITTIVDIKPVQGCSAKPERPTLIGQRITPYRERISPNEHQKVQTIWPMLRTGIHCNSTNQIASATPVETATILLLVTAFISA